ncbi:MAG: VCBS repeat-containing protein, partial [Polyangiaceae bacterium]|nr:VCBS repeat-containing protein [Polyangiaceae bacterium]
MLLAPLAPLVRRGLLALAVLEEEAPPEALDKGETAGREGEVLRARAEQRAGEQGGQGARSRGQEVHRLGAEGAEGRGAGLGGDGGGSGCPTGELCEGGLCAGGICCKAHLACGESCCEEGTLCSFGTCVAPGKACFDSSDCGESEYCERGGSEPSGSGGAAGQCSGGSGAEGVCLPLPPICADGESGVGPAGQITCLQKCEVKPSFVDFTPELKYAWGGQVVPPTATDVMMTPIVVQLDDDDCDGKVTERDIPEIVFTTFASGAYTQAGTLHAISIVNGQIVEKWSVPGAFHAGKHIAGGDLDGLPGSEIVGCTTAGTVQAYRSDGTLLWTSTLVGCGQPALADMDGDGKPEVVVEGGILHGATGATKAIFSPAMVGTFAVS